MSFVLELLKKIPLSKAGPAAGVLLGLIMVVVIGYRMRWWQRLERILGVWFWIGLMLLVVIGIVVALLWLLPRYREKRFLERLHSEDERTPQMEVKESYSKLQEKMLEALHTLQNAPELKKKEGLPLYALPWYLLLGASQSGKTMMLQGVATHFAPFARPPSTAEEPSQDCEWWFFNTAIVLDTPGFYAFPTEIEREGAQWYRFLHLLRHYRDLQPINGLVITVAADTLASRSKDQLHLEATELRKRVDEMIRELGIDFPVYLLITRCDLIEGFTEFCNNLPEQTLRKVFGYVHDWQPSANGQQSHPSETLQFDAIFASLVERLQQLRLSMLNAESPLALELHQQIFCFPEEFQALQQPLSVFVDTLLLANPFQHTPRFRGMFFSSACQQGLPVSFLRRELRLNGQSRSLTKGAKTYFLHDLLAHILPRDQYLVRSTGRATRGRLFKHLFGLAICVGLCLMLLMLLTKAFIDDRRIYATVDQTRCADTTEEISNEPRLAATDLCRQEIQALHDRNGRRHAWGKLVFNRSGRLETQLHQRYVNKFDTEVLSPLDTRLTHYLSTEGEAIPLVFLLIKRIEWLNQCLSETGCSKPPPPAKQPDYQLMLNPAQRDPVSAQQVEQLQHTYEAYLRWSLDAPEGLRRERDAHAERLRQWFEAKRFAPQQIVGWATDNYAPVMAEQYWQAPPPKGGRDTAQVVGAYTREAWQQSIDPFLRRAHAAVPEMAPQLAAFRDLYRQQYFAQWQHFLAAFPLGEEAWNRTPERRQKLALLLLSEASPYNRILDVGFENLQPFLPAPPQAASAATQLVQEPNSAGSEVAIPPWSRLLQQYIGSESRKSFVASLQQAGEQLADGALEEQSFRLALAGFQAGKPTAESTHPILKAWWIVRDLRKQEGTGVGEDTFWALLERPVRFVWEVILREAGRYLQERWTEEVMAPSEGLSELDRLDFLYGPQGKVRMFVDEWAKPFLAENEKRRGQVLDAEVPLATAFFDTLEVARQIASVLSNPAPQRVRVEAGGKSDPNADVNLVEEKTEFRLECATKVYRVTNRPQTLADMATTIFWSFDACGDVEITVFVSCDSFCVERAAAVGLTVPEVSMLGLRKLYRGQAGFLRFIQDFTSGAHEFRMADFADSYLKDEWQKLKATLHTYGIQAIRVLYRVDVPDTLAKLLLLMSGSMVAAKIVE